MFRLAQLSYRASCLPAGLIGRKDQSSDIPAAWIGGFHFLISAATNPLKYSGDRRSGATMVAPNSLNRACTAGVSIAATVASWSLWTTAAGVPLGRKNAFQALASKLTSPCS